MFRPEPPPPDHEAGDDDGGQELVAEVSEQANAGDTVENVAEVVLGLLDVITSVWP